MSQIITVGLDLAKTVFQLHGADRSAKADDVFATREERADPRFRDGFWVSEVLIHQRIKVINALPGHLMEFDQIVAQATATIPPADGPLKLSRPCSLGRGSPLLNA